MLNKITIRTDLERPSIRKFMEDHKNLFKGRVLDFGSGSQPYKDLVSGEYIPYDLDLKMPFGKFDVIICNQVMQYITNPAEQIKEFYSLLNKDGLLIMTYPTHWEEVELEDLWRFTKTGMGFLLFRAGFKVIEHTERCSIPFEDFKLSIGYGVIAKKH